MDKDELGKFCYHKTLNVVKVSDRKLAIIFELFIKNEQKLHSMHSSEVSALFYGFP